MMEHIPSDGDLKTRCLRASQLTYVEQQAQLYYLKQIWKLYDIIFNKLKHLRSMVYMKFKDELKELGLIVEENDLASILKLWKHRSYDKGTQIQVSDNKGGVNSGKFLGLDELGGLIVSDNSGTKKIYSGDVYFGS